MTGLSDGAAPHPRPIVLKASAITKHLLTDVVQLRPATLILPRTGERVKRVVTLREPYFDGPVDGPAGLRDGAGDHASVHSPLLGHRRLRRASINTESSAVDSVGQRLGRKARTFWQFCTSQTGQGVLKCSLAYLLGSMVTFVPALSGFLGKQDGKHMVATITVYFHPARSQGSMFEAVIMASVAFLYAAFVSLTSMFVTKLFNEELDLIILGHMIVLVIFCGGSLGFVGWVKQRLGNPLVNVACSLTSLAIITVLTKEGSVQAGQFSLLKVTQVMKMVAMGVMVTTFVCFAIRPMSARKELKQKLIEATDCLGDMLRMITRSFLTGSEEELRQRSFREAVSRFKKCRDALPKVLKEAKWEHYFWGTEAEHRLERRLVNCVQRLSHSAGGLRSAASTQFSLLAEAHRGGGATPPTSIHTPTSIGLRQADRVDSWVWNQENFAVLESIAEAENEDSEEYRHGDSTAEQYSSMSTNPTPSEIFERFIIHLGPSVKSLAFTLKQILDELPYGPAPKFEIAINAHFRSSLVQALELYSRARKDALTLLYKSKDMRASRPKALEADFEEVAASCGYFSFSLEHFAEEMKTYLDILEELKSEMETSSRKRSWNWLKLWRKTSHSRRNGRAEDGEQENLILDHQEVDIVRGEINPKDTVDALKEELQPSRDQNMRYRIWRGTRFLRRDDIKFAIKVGSGAALYALPSFVPSLRPTYAHWRGEWGLLSYMLVCSMTIGSSNTTGLARIFGTCVGAICAMVAWFISQGNVFAMALLGWMMSVVTSWLIVAKGKGPMGRFIMLTYNLSALYAYSLSVRDEHHDEDEGGDNPIIGEIALHRVVAVVVGCVWGLIISRLVWPISARKKFKDGLCILLLRMGLIWKRDPLTVRLEGDSAHPYMNLKEEFQLQLYHDRLRGLCEAATYEFELKGAFPSTEFASILQSVERMLDAFHAMNVVITKDLKASEGEAEILRRTEYERAHLSARICHLFQVLASSLKLEFPLNDALPGCQRARDRLLAKIFHFRMEKRRAIYSDEDYALLYAYGRYAPWMAMNMRAYFYFAQALVTHQLSQEISEVGQEVERLYGVLDEDMLKLQ